jgi:peptide/nickel transport system permease protein
MADVNSSADVAVTEVLAADPVPAAADDLSAGDGVLRKKWGVAFWISAAFVIGLALAALFAPMLPLRDPEALAQCPIMQGPSASHLMGCDDLGRDVFARVIWGARISLTVGFASIVFGMLVGGLLGVIAGYVKGAVDKVISFLFLVELSFPALILALLITSFANRTLPTIALTLGILAIAPIGRLARAVTMQVAQREYVQAARGLGATTNRILRAEILPNVIMPMFALALLAVALAIVAEGALAYLGLSVKEGISWGKIIAAGTEGDRLKQGAHVAFSAIGVLFATVLSLNYIGDRIRERLEVREVSL